MGTDNLFHKRKKRKVKSLRRRPARIAPHDVVLIACEGEKTEPHYFEELKQAFRLSNANIRVSGRGVDPLSLVDFAIQTYRKEPDFDCIYCVFDQDRHKTYYNALDKIRRTRLKGGGRIFAVPSVPCFEFWILLHFTYTTRPFDAPAGGSICQQVIRQLEKYLPGYQKNDRGIFRQTQGFLDIAITRARQVKKFHQTSGTDNPSTNIHHLVEYLRGLKKQ